MHRSTLNICHRATELCALVSELALFRGKEDKVFPAVYPDAKSKYEVIHCVVDTIKLIDTLLEKGIKPEKPNQEPAKYGRGIAITEVPRGILFHDYTYNRQGSIEAANCVIPTGQNLANIDDDMKKLVPEIIEESKEDITKKLEMLVRAYDPCISCSVHMLDVEFVE